MTATSAADADVFDNTLGAKEEGTKASTAGADASMAMMAMACWIFMVDMR